MPDIVPAKKINEAIAEAKTIGETMDVRNWISSLTEHAKRINAEYDHLMDLACAKIACERKCGAIIRQMKARGELREQKNGRPKKSL